MNRHERYNRSEKGKARSDRYRATDKGIITELKTIGRRNIVRTNKAIQELESQLEGQVQKYVELLHAKED